MSVMTNLYLFNECWLQEGWNHTCLVHHCILGQCMRPGGNICQMSEWIFRTAATLKYVSHWPFNYSPSLAFRFQKLNIPCLQLEINIPLSVFFSIMWLNLKLPRKPSIMFINGTSLFIQKENTLQVFAIIILCQAFKPSLSLLSIFDAPLHGEEVLTACVPGKQITPLSS